MKSLSIILISLLTLALASKNANAQPFPPMVITLDNSDPIGSAQEIFDSLQVRRIDTYRGFQTDLQTFVQEALLIKPACYTSNCPPLSSPIVHPDLGEGIMIEFQGIQTSLSTENTISSYIRFDTAPVPFTQNASHMASIQTTTFFDFPLSIAGNTVIIVSMVDANGIRGDAQAFIIADKYILRN